MTTGSGHPLRVALVCLGNICRSPMADVVLEKKLADAGLADEVHVDSAGTGDWHRGEPMDPRAAAIHEEKAPASLMPSWRIWPFLSSL